MIYYYQGITLSQRVVCTVCVCHLLCILVYVYSYGRCAGEHCDSRALRKWPGTMACVLSTGCSVLSCVLSKEGCSVLVRRSERDHFPGLAFSICRLPLCVTRSFRFIWGEKRQKRDRSDRSGGGGMQGRERCGHWWKREERPRGWGRDDERGLCVSGATVEMG